MTNAEIGLGSERYSGITNEAIGLGSNRYSNVTMSQKACGVRCSPLFSIPVVGPPMAIKCLKKCRDEIATEAALAKAREELEKIRAAEREARRVAEQAALDAAAGIGVTGTQLSVQPSMGVGTSVLIVGGLLVLIAIVALLIRGRAKS